MTLLIFLLAAIAVGYWLSRSKYQQSIDDTASQFASSSQSWSARAENWWHSNVMKRSLDERFTSWVGNEGSKFLPDEFTSWYSSIPESDRISFTNNLESNLNKQGFDLRDLLQGAYDNQPVRMQVYVEAIVVTSQEFRKTKEVEEPNSTKSEKKKPKTAEKKTAEKQTSRRRNPNPDTSEAAV